MKLKELIISYKEFQEGDKLSLEDNNLLESAKLAAQNAYAPYSKFKVGAAVLLDNGEIISASNQENAAYPSGLCAERVAIFYAHAKYPKATIVSIAITAYHNGKQQERATYPCGACRQVMAESELRGGKSLRIIVGGEKIVQIVESTSALLPFAFDNLPQ